MERNDGDERPRIASASVSDCTTLLPCGDDRGLCKELRCLMAHRFLRLGEMLRDGFFKQAPSLKRTDWTLRPSLGDTGAAPCAMRPRKTAELASASWRRAVERIRLVTRSYSKPQTHAAFAGRRFFAYEVSLSRRRVAPGRRNRRDERDGGARAADVETMPAAAWKCMRKCRCGEWEHGSNDVESRR